MDDATWLDAPLLAGGKLDGNASRHGFIGMAPPVMPAGDAVEDGDRRHALGARCRKRSRAAKAVAVLDNHGGHDEVDQKLGQPEPVAVPAGVDFLDLAGDRGTMLIGEAAQTLHLAPEVVALVMD
jgi:hypothetical protein